MPKAPAQADHLTLPDDNLATRPADRQIDNSFPARLACDSAFSAHDFWRFGQILELLAERTQEYRLHHAICHIQADWRCPSASTYDCNTEIDRIDNIAGPEELDCAHNHVQS